MITKILKLTLCFSISLAFSQNSFVNLSIEGMHCAGGCAKMIENSLNSNKGITAAVDFNNASASIIYDAASFTENKIIGMINEYRDGKFTATSLNTAKKSCSKGKNCCKSSGNKNAQCDNNSSTSNSNSKLSSKKRKKQKSNTLSGMIPGHTGCTKSCCSSKK
tara:strand:- start:9947 stop:10435 length:489 start_codon:yes stop_codon:yes gene_type:complete